MAYIGMRKPIIAPITTRVDGSAITYGTPIVVGPAVSANITFDIADNPDYGDDIIVDNDKGVNGYNVALETNDICKEARAAALGWKPHTETTTGEGNTTTTTVTHYEVIDGPAPEVGMGYTRVKMFRGEKIYEGFFMHAMQFSSGGENASTKQKQIAWNHPSMNGTGIGCYLDDSGDVRFFDWMEFETEGDAETWIYGKFGTTPPSAESAATAGTGTST